jgi:hypothetical protein
MMDSGKVVFVTVIVMTAYLNPEAIRGTDRGFDSFLVRV